MRTIVKRLIFAAAIGGTLSAAIAVRLQSVDENDAGLGDAAREVAPLFQSRDFANAAGSAVPKVSVAAKPAEEFPALANLQQVIARLRSALVADDLKLTPEQLTALRAADDAYDIMNSQYFKLLDPTTDMKSEMARFRAFGEHNQREAEFREQTLRILEPSQKRRLHEIMCRTFGLMAFEIEEIAVALQLSDEQRTRAAKASLEASEAQWRLIQAAGMDKPHTVTAESERIDRECRLRQHELSDQALKTVLAEFSDDQKAAYEKLIGAPIDVFTVLEQWTPDRFTRFMNPSLDDANSGPARATIVPTITTR